MASTNAPLPIDAFVFSGARLDQVNNKRGDEAYLSDMLASDKAVFMIFHQHKPLVTNKNNLKQVLFKTRAELPPKILQVGDQGQNLSILLGLDRNHGNRPTYVVSVSEIDWVPSNETFLDFRMIVNVIADPSDIALISQGRSLVEWHSKSKFCGRCGSKTTSYFGGWKRRCTNGPAVSYQADTAYAKPEKSKDDTACGVSHYPRVDPVVIAAVISTTGKFLLARQARWPPGVHSLVSGFMSPGETIEDAVRREVLEETGIKIGKVSYVASQPWPFAGELMIGAIAYATDDDIQIDQELEFAGWFSRGEVLKAYEVAIGPQGEFFGSTVFRIPPAFAIAHHIIKGWLFGSSNL